MTIVINVKADEMRAATNAGETSVSIEIPDAVRIDDAKCVKCGEDVGDDIDAVRLAALISGLSWMHNKAYDTIKAGDDFMAIKTTELIAEAITEFTA